MNKPTIVINCLQSFICPKCEDGLTIISSTHERVPDCICLGCKKIYVVEKEGDRHESVRTI